MSSLLCMQSVKLQMSFTFTHSTISAFSSFVVISLSTNISKINTTDHSCALPPLQR